MMATTSPSSAPGTAGWTQIDALSSSTIISVQNRDNDQRMGVVFAVSDPTSGVAWNGDGAWLLDGGGAEMWGKAATEHAWARMETTTAAAKPVVQEKL